MGNRVEELKPEYVEFIPKELKEGIIYISLEYGSAQHLCACGCGLPTITPINPRLGGWEFKDEEGLITLQPSIGNFRYPCRSHYWLRKGKIVWC